MFEPKHAVRLVSTGAPTETPADKFSPVVGLNFCAGDVAMADTARDDAQKADMNACRINPQLQPAQGDQDANDKKGKDPKADREGGLFGSEKHEHEGRNGERRAEK